MVENVFIVCLWMATTQKMFELSVAPMMEFTTRHQRYFARLLCQNTIMYTEMIVDSTVVHREDDLEHFYGHHQLEHPVVLQLGGNDVENLTRSAILGEQWGFDEINLNCGCPSNKVSCKGMFGARLMLQTDLVRSIVKSMKEHVSIPVTVKCRLGVDDHDSYEFVHDFVAGIPECDHFIIHARKCLLKGLSPVGNRNIPPLQYERVYQLCKDFPDKKFTLNGGLTELSQVKQVLEEEPRLHGVMLGRAAWSDPCLLANIEHHLQGVTSRLTLTRRQVVSEYEKYCIEMVEEGGFKKQDVLKPLSQIMNGRKGARAFRRILNEACRSEQSIQELIETAMSEISDDILDEPIIQPMATEQQEKEDDGENVRKEPEQEVQQPVAQSIAQ